MHDRRGGDTTSEVAARGLDPLVTDRVVLRGARRVELDGVAVQLAPREAALLAELARRPGSVVPKAVLLQRVWGGAADEHAVEVTVARLRRRLGDALVIETVPRRGYRLAVD